MNKMLFELKKVESLWCSFCRAKDETLVEKNFRIFLVSLSVFQVFCSRVYFGCHKTLNPFKPYITNLQNYLYQAREKKNLHFNKFTNYLTKIRDLAILKDSGKYNKK